MAWLLRRVIGVVLLLVLALCAAPSIAQTKIVNGQAMLPWVTGDYEKPVIIEVVGDSNATTGAGSSSPNTSNNHHFYHSIYVGLLKWTPYDKLGGMEWPSIVGHNPALFGTSSFAGTGKASHFRYSSPLSMSGIAPGQATPAGTTTGIHNPGIVTGQFSGNSGDGYYYFFSARTDAAWCVNDPDWYYDNRALEVKWSALLATNGLTTGAIGVTRGGTEAIGEGTISSPTVDANTSITFANAGGEAWTSFGTTVAASTSPLFRTGLRLTGGAGSSENGTRVTMSLPLLRVATPTRGEPVFATQSTGGWTIRNFDNDAGYNVSYVGRFTDTALQNRIDWLVDNYAGTRQDVTLIVWMRLGTNDGSNDSATAAAWDTRTQLLITRYRAAAAAVGVTPHFVLDAPSDPGDALATPTQSAKFDRIEAGNALAAAALDQPSSRVIALNKRAILNARDPGCNGTLRGPFNASTNTVGGIVDEATDVHINDIGAEIEIDGIWDAAQAEWPVENDASLNLVDSSRRMLQDKEPFYWIQFFGDNYGGGGNPNGIRGDAYSDIAGFMNEELTRAATLGFKRVMIHTPGGKVYSSTGFYYGADQRRIMPAGFETYFTGQFRTDLARLGLRADVYIGAVWEPLADPLVVGSYAPMIDPLIEEDNLTSQVLWWKTSANMTRVWFDAIGTYTENATRKISVDRTADWLFGRGCESGGEPIPVINSGGWRIDEARAYDRPWMVTETALAGFSNNANYRVPAGAVMYVVFAANEATQARVRQRINQGFIVCAWNDTANAVMADILTLQTNNGRSRDRSRSRRVGHRHRRSLWQSLKTSTLTTK